MINWQAFNIDLGRGAGRTSGYVKTYCPHCHENGKPKSDHSLSCNVETGAFKCHRCGWQGYATVVTPEEKEAWMRQQPWYKDFSAKKTVEKKEYAKPPQPRSSAIDPKIVAYFAGRGISEATLKKMHVTSGTDWMPAHKEHRKPEGGKCTTIHFNYVKDGEVVATKLRSGDKCFRQAKAGCEQIAYNLDNIKNAQDCYIVEGEMDALSLAEIGYLNVVSVPDGGSDTRLHWLVDYFEEYFADKKTVYICSDNDDVGSKLMNELSKHFDPGQYVVVTDYGTDPKTGAKNKDANDCLMHNGPDELRLRLSQGKSVSPEGDADMERLSTELDDLYENGLPQGLKIGFPELDRLLRLQKGRLYIVTGTPGSGKSQFLDQIAEKMNYHYGWRFSMFSPEMMPLPLHMSMLVSKFTGKPFNKQEMPRAMYEAARDRVKDAIHFIDPDDYELDDILAIARYQVRKYGCDALILDPWNDLMQDGDGITKTDDINKALLKILTFAQRQDIVVFVMAHPTKQERRKDGTYGKTTLNDISGGAHFRNRADFGIVLVRHNAKDEDNTTGQDYTEVIVEKVRFANLGQMGTACFRYQVGVGRFHPYDLVTGETHWDETNHITTPARQLPMFDEAAGGERKAESGKGEGNVQGFLEQARRQEQALKPRTEPDDLPVENDNEDIFDDNEEVPY